MSSHCNNNNSFYPYPMQKTSYYGCSQQQYNTAACPSNAPMYHPPYYPPPYYAYPPPHHHHPPQNPPPQNPPHQYPPYQHPPYQHHDPYSSGDVLNSIIDDQFSPPDYDKHLYENEHDHCSDDDQATIESQVCDSIPLQNNNEQQSHNHDDSHTQTDVHHQPNQNNHNDNDDDIMSCCTVSTNYTNSTYTSTCSTINNNKAVVPSYNPQPIQDTFILRVPKNRKGKIYLNK